MQGPATTITSFWSTDAVYEIPAGYTLGGCDVVPSVPMSTAKDEATPLYGAFLPSPSTDYRFEYDLLDASTRESLPGALTPEVPFLSPPNLMAMHPLLQSQTLPWIDTSAFYDHSNICIPSSTMTVAAPALKVNPNSRHETKKRTQLTCEQRDYLLKVFERDSMPKSKALQKVALDCKMDYRQVQYWFQNRRAAMRRRMAATESSL
ncbi:UNVERIFIED_CONTAM: hypothetical protein HDU68_005897 [Siphonaria sp. JEL0065]|nr:hypothetical protein HDU68_005897 [Siphonaria sp. JEL0065]